MKINYTGKDIKPTDAIEEYAEKRLEKINKYFSDEDTEVQVHITFRKEGILEIADLTLIAAGDRYQSISEHEDLYTAIDKVVDVLERQIRKLKEKRDSNKRDTVDKYENLEEEYEVENEIIKYAEFDIKPISEEDAKLLLSEHRTNNFLVFKNIDTGKTNVIFKLKDGKNYGIIMPEI